jgi:ABC-2 type transport system ATP-binding protein
VLLTTQYLEEADALADRITMLAAGRVAAEGSPDELKARVGGDWLDVTPADPGDLPRLAGLCAPLAAGPPLTDGGVLRIPVTDRTRALVGDSAALSADRIDPLDLSVRRPTLDEAFLALTGAGTGVAR